jgi:hypothetical protein
MEGIDRRVVSAKQGRPMGLELAWTDVNKLLTCPGWWDATGKTDPTPPNIVDLHCSLIRGIVTACVEENPVWRSLTN